VSDQPVSYYSLILKDVAVEAGQGDAFYQQLLKGGGDAHLPAIANAPPGVASDDDSDCGFDVADSSRPEPLPKRQRTVAKARPLALPPALVPPLPVPLADDALHLGDTDSSSSDSSSSSEESSCSFDVAHGRSTVHKWITLDFPTPVLIKLDRYKAKGKPEYFRFICRCSHHGKSCTKKRNVNINRALGPKEPVAFLLAWLELGATLTLEEHSVRNIVVPHERVVFFAASMGTKADVLLNLLK
jgi:hypothetical protein